MKPINLRIAEELGVREQQVATAISLLDGGATVAGFYERNGAVRIGEAPSDAVPGRLLPLYELRLIPRGPS
jgi:protein Tex